MKLSSDSRLSNRPTSYADDVAGQGRCSKRSHAPFTDEHLKRLGKIALEDQEGLFERNPHLAVYRKRLKLIALCQGGALHILDCKKGLKHTNGVKDLDVYSFYAKHPKVAWPYRRHGVKDFGPSVFGYHPIRRAGFVGRHVDLMGRALPVKPGANPVEAVRNWLITSNNPTPWHLRQKAVVGLYPARYRGEIVWDHSVDL
jgi:hypothetical protein